jgi:carboxypeptidase PM20D1
MPFVITAVVAAVLVFAVVLVLRTVAFKPQTQLHNTIDLPVSGLETSVQRFTALLKKQTVSDRDFSRVDTGPFKEFIALLPELYPAVHGVLSRELVAGYSMLYHWRGVKSGSPVVLMAHYDVVPASPEGWEQPPFGGVVTDGVIWGRGSIDTKVTLTSIFEAVERLVKEGFTPQHDIYLSFGADEEIGGVNGTPSIVALLKERSVEPAMVIDEGGAVVSNLFPGVSKPIAVIGTAEKGRTDLEMTVKGAGGHASTPPKDDPAARLAKAIVRLHKKPFKAHFSATNLEMFDTLGRYTPFGIRLIFANLWLFQPLLLHMFTKNGGETNAMCRTTFAVTTLEGSNGANVLPSTVRAVANIRNAVGETVDFDVDYIRNVIDDDRVALSTVFSAEPSPVSDTKSEEYRILKETVGETYPEAIVTPYIMIAQSDSRHYGAICSNVFRFTPLELSKKERESMHNSNECLPVAKFGKCIEFYLRLIKKL